MILTSSSTSSTAAASSSAAAAMVLTVGRLVAAVLGGAGRVDFSELRKNARRWGEIPNERVECARDENAEDDEGQGGWGGA